MHNDDDDFEPVVSRLRSVRQQPLDHALAQRVLARAHRSRLSWLRATKVKVAAALAAGFMIGSVSLASAGALPGQAQDVAHAALGALGVDVPPGHDRYNGPECGDVKNHGEYVEAHPDDPAAAKSPCGKPMKSVNHPHRKGTDPAGAPGDVKGPGRPPWAGQGKGKTKDKTNDDSPTPAVATTTTATVADTPSTTAGTSDSGTSPTTDSPTTTVATTAP